MLPKPSKREIIDLYLTGLSTRKVASQLNVSFSYVGKIVKDAGVSRLRVDAIIAARPAKSKHWRSAREAARRIWVRTYGPIPSGYHIHHKDGDFTNNDLNNLECISAAAHMRLHHAGPEYHIPRHLRPARKQYMNTYDRTQDAVCEWCRVEFKQDKYELNPTCSRSCGAKLDWSRRASR